VFCIDISSIFVIDDWAKVVVDEVVFINIIPPPPEALQLDNPVEPAIEFGFWIGQGRHWPLSRYALAKQLEEQVSDPSCELVFAGQGLHVKLVIFKKVFAVQLDTHERIEVALLCEVVLLGQGVGVLELGKQYDPGVQEIGLIVLTEQYFPEGHGVHELLELK
jgi:hypothetical protein